MSTRSRIGVLNEDNTIRPIYCHHDGYPSYVGKMLMEHYRSITKIQKLLELGDISVLEAEIGEQHPFSLDYEYTKGGKYIHKHTTEYGSVRWYEYPSEQITQWEKWVLAYGRDRGETEHIATDHRNERAFLKYADGTDAEYAYLFKSGEWFVTENITSRKVKWLTIPNALKLEEAVSA